MIHDIAVKMMEHWIDLLRFATRNSENEDTIYQKEACLFEEYATVLDAIFFQMEPERWDPETSGDMLDLAQLQKIASSDGVLFDRRTEK